MAALPPREILPETTEDPGPWTLLTARLRIRPVEPHDVAALHAVRSHSPFQPQRGIGETERLVADMVAAGPGTQPGWHQFMLVHLSDEMVIGDIGVRFDHPSASQAELGFSLHPDWRGRGLAYEGVGRMINHLFGSIQLHRLTAMTDRRNTAARLLLEALRFRLEGRYLQSAFTGGAWVDERSYARLAGE